MKTQKQKRNMKKKYVIKKGAGFFSNMSARARGAFNSARTTSRNVARSMYQNRGNLLQSAKDVGSSSKYLFSLIANPSNVHRMLFKNAHFIDFINFQQIQRLYCNRSSLDCIRLENGYLYSNNPAVVQSSEQAVNQDVQETQMDIKNTPVDPSVPPQQAAALQKAVIANQIADEHMEDNMGPVSSFADQTFKRLAFAKLNDAILTDNPQLVNSDTQYISFTVPPLFEFFHTYKFQVNRSLWYAGWGEWMYITNKVINLLLINDELSNAFLNELWGTVGLIKIMSKYPKDKRDKLIETIKNGQEQQAAQQTSTEGTQLADAKLQELDAEENANLPSSATQAPPVSRFSRFTRSVRNGMTYMGNSMSSAMGLNISKYRVYRKLLKYYDIDPGKYNMNLLKRTGVLKSNYPIFMVREAQKAVQMAINNLNVNRNTKIMNVNTNLGQNPMGEMPPEQNQDIMAMENAKLDNLLNQLMVFNQDTQGIQNLQGISGGKRNKKGKKNRTKRVKMTGGSQLFFTNIATVFKAAYNKMIDNQIDNINMYASQNPDNAEYVAKFFAEIIKCHAMMTMTLCMTLANYALYALPLPVSMPHCIISNLMYMYVVFKMRLINMDQINVMEKMGYNQNNQDNQITPPPPEIGINPVQVQGQQIEVPPPSQPMVVGRLPMGPQ